MDEDGLRMNGRGESYGNHVTKQGLAFTLIVDLDN